MGNMAMYICPAPIHYNLLSVNDDGEHAENENDRAMYTIKLSVRRNPIKEALIRIGPQTFDLDEMLETLADIDNNDDIKRTKPAKKRLKEELLCIRGCYKVKTEQKNDSDEYSVIKPEKGVDQFNAAEFLEHNEEQKKQNEDRSDDQCHICGKSNGELLLCDGCPHVFHLQCVGLECVPDGVWYCKECVAKKDGVNDVNGSNHNVKNEENVDIEMAENKLHGGNVFGAIFMANKGERISDVKEINDVLVETKKEENEVVDMEMPEPDIDVVADVESTEAVQNGMDMIPSPNASDSGKDEVIIKEDDNEQFVFNDDAENEMNEQQQQQEVIEETIEQKDESQQQSMPPVAQQQSDQIAEELNINNVDVEMNENAESVEQNVEMNENEMEQQIEVPQIEENENQSHQIEENQNEQPLQLQIEANENETIQIVAESEHQSIDLNLLNNNIHRNDINNDSVSNDTICSSDNNENVQVAANRSEQEIDSENEKQQNIVDEIVDNNDNKCDDVKMTNINNVDVEQKECEELLEKEQLQKNELQQEDAEECGNNNLLFTNSQEF